MVLWVGQWDLATPSPVFGRCVLFKSIFADEQVFNMLKFQSLCREQTDM